MKINVAYPVIDMKRTGENIKKLRKERDISIAEVQEFLGISGPQAIYRWQWGESIPCVDHLCALSHLFGVTMNEILVLTENEDDCQERSDPVAKKSHKTFGKKIFLFMAA